MHRVVNIRKVEAAKYRRNPWLVRWYSPDGKRPQRSFPTRAAAQRYADRIAAQLRAEAFDEIIPLEWKDLLTAFLAAKKADQLAVATLERYRSDLEAFGRVTCEPRSTQITLRTVDLYKAHLADKAPTTINRHLRHLSCIFNWAKKRHYMRSNPAAESGKIREPRRQPRALTPEEFGLLLGACTDPQWLVLIHLAVNGVARKWSIAAIKKTDVDLDHGVVKCYDQKQKQYRSTPLHPVSLAVLAEYMESLPAKQEELFTCRFHNTTWQAMVKRANVPYIKFHHLRTCMSSWLKNEGVSADVVSRIFGHTSPTLTYQVYTALDDVESKRRALDKLPFPVAKQG